jgi:protein O-mannosyl-transferase
VVFLPAIRNGFVNWDDDHNVTMNSNVQQMNATGLKGIFTSSVTGGYTPLTSLTFMLEYHFFGLKPAVYHVNNLLLHVLCTLLVFLLLRKLGTSLFTAFAAALLFGVHPMRVESVAWVSERKDVLYGLFYLLSLIHWVRYRKEGGRKFYYLALVLFVPALLSKIQAVTLPLVMVMVDYYLDKRFQWKQLTDKIPFFLFSLAFGVLGLYILGHQGELDAGRTLTLVQRVFIGTFTLVTYIYKAVVPWPLSAVYSYPDTLSAMHYLSAAVVAVAAWLIYRYARKGVEIVFGVLVFLFNVMFMLQVVGAGQALMADRFTYLAYIGLFYLMALAIEKLSAGRWKTAAMAVGTIYVMLLCAATWNRTRVWRNTETLFTDVIKKYPKEVIAYNNLGLYYRDEKQVDRAIRTFSTAIEMEPAAYTMYNNRAEALYSKGEVAKAMEDISMALKINPDYSKALTNRGAIRASGGQFDLALRDLDKSLAIDGKDQKALSNRALIYYTTDRFEPAIADATTFLRLNPVDTDMINLRGLCYGRLNRTREAMEDFNKAIALSPTTGAYYENRSYLWFRLKDAQKALDDILKARSLGCQIDPNYLKRLQGNVP